MDDDVPIVFPIGRDHTMAMAWAFALILQRDESDELPCPHEPRRRSIGCH